MPEDFEGLAAEVAASGGQMKLPPDAVSARFGTNVSGDSYAQYVLKRRMSDVGLTVRFRPDGTVELTSPTQKFASTGSVAPSEGPTPRASAASARLAPGAPEVIREPRAAPRAQAPSHRGSVPDVPGPQPRQPAPPTAVPPGTSPGSPSAVTSEQAGKWLYALLVFACSFVPAIGHQLAPGGEVGEKKDAFFAIYFATFPLSLAATFIFLMLMMKWFDSDKQRLTAAGSAIVASAIWGIGFGNSYADINAISQLHGPAWAVLLELVALALFAYAKYYGAVMFVAGVLSSLFAALWIKEKLEKL